jgi:predicted DCC family thiol-disulfide oxidoreductase YuxK
VNAQLNVSPELLFYDGHCGLCHRAVLFVIKHDPEGKLFRFAPLQGETFKSRLPEKQRATLPDSMIIETQNGALLLRSDAWIHILRRLGGKWKLLATLLSLSPRPLRDFLYNRIASVRHKMFRGDNVCPLVPPELSARFNPHRARLN